VRTFGTLSAWRRRHGANVVWRIVTERRSATPASVAAIAACLLALGFAVNASHVAHGGFYSDDWSRAAAFRFGGYVTQTADLWRDVVPGRPVHALLTPLPHALFGLEPRWHLAAAIVLAVSASVALFGFLRALGVAVQHRRGVLCGTDAISSLQLDDAPPGRYGDRVFVDLAERRAIRIRSRRDCQRALRTLRPGPLFLRRSRG
jgi:hypothetical protein